MTPDESRRSTPVASLHIYRDEEGAPCAYADIPEMAAEGVIWHRIPFGTALAQAESEARMIAGRIGVTLQIRDPLGLGSDAQVGDLGALHPQDLNASNDD